jgi:branched-chain amino acid transport system substrate-binding protein
MKRRKLLTAAAAASVLAPCAGWAAERRSDSVAPGAEIRLGQTADLSASRAIITKAYSQGASIWFEAVNRRGGVNGRKIRVVQMDDAYQVDRALENAGTLIDREGVFALVHSVGTGITDKLIPLLDDRGVPHIHPLTGADQVRPPARPSAQTFFLRASYGREVERIVGQLQTLGIRRVALVHEDEPFGNVVRDAVRSSMARTGNTPVSVGVIPFNATAAEQVAPAVRAAAAGAPQAVIVGSAGPSVEQFVKLYHETGAKAQFYCLSVSNVERLYKAVAELSQGVIVTQVMPDVQSSNMQVVREYRAATHSAGATPSGFSLEGYISARMITAGLQAAGGALTRARFLRAMEASLSPQIGGFPVRYKENAREGSPFVELAMIGPGGKLVR